MTSHHNLFVSAAHTEADLQRAWDIFDEALKKVRLADITVNPA